MTEKRLARVYSQRTKKEYTLFCQALAAAYPKAKKIRLVQDKLNTHNASAFYENLPAAEAFALAKRFEFHYTPKSASWLNMIEIEFSAVARQCLDRHIPTIKQLEKVDWQDLSRFDHVEASTLASEIGPGIEVYTVFAMANNTPSDRMPDLQQRRTRLPFQRNSVRQERQHWRRR